MDYELPTLPLFVTDEKQGVGFSCERLRQTAGTPTQFRHRKFIKNVMCAPSSGALLNHQYRRDLSEQGVIPKFSTRQDTSAILN